MQKNAVSTNQSLPFQQWCCLILLLSVLACLSTKALALELHSSPMGISVTTSSQTFLLEGVDIDRLNGLPQQILEASLISHFYSYALNKLTDVPKSALLAHPLYSVSIALKTFFSYNLFYKGYRFANGLMNESLAAADYYHQRLTEGKRYGYMQAVTDSTFAQRHLNLRFVYPKSEIPYLEIHRLTGITPTFEASDTNDNHWMSLYERLYRDGYQTLRIYPGLTHGEVKVQLLESSVKTDASFIMQLEVPESAHLDFEILRQQIPAPETYQQSHLVNTLHPDFIGLVLQAEHTDTLLAPPMISDVRQSGEAMAFIGEDSSTFVSNFSDALNMQRGVVYHTRSDRLKNTLKVSQDEFLTWMKHSRAEGVINNQNPQIILKPFQAESFLLGITILGAEVLEGAYDSIKSHSTTKPVIDSVSDITSLDKTSDKFLIQTLPADTKISTIRLASGSASGTETTTTSSRSLNGMSNRNDRDGDNGDGDGGGNPPSQRICNLCKQQPALPGSDRCKNCADIEHDGVTLDKPRDPPGQKCTYILPGDRNLESYRLSTFIRYPNDAPVNPRILAACGFFYTGYKDRVKCFCCGRNVESWTINDDVTSSRWHTRDCQLTRGAECGNVPIGFSRLNRPTAPARRHGQSGSPSQPAASGSALHSQSPASNNPHRQPTAGSILMQQAPQQSARSVLMGNHNQQTASAQPSTAITSVTRPTTHRAPPSFFEFATMPSVNHERFVRDLDVSKELDRRKSFRGYTSEHVVHAHDLAKSGFFFLGNSDRVQCFSCGGVLRNWKPGDDVKREHARHFPTCRMVQNREFRNTPAPQSATPPLASPPPALQPLPSTRPDFSAEDRRNLNALFPCLHPISPYMRDIDSRLETFDNRWPAHKARATPQQIAEAGFFFLGERDRVKCYYCNGGLQNWEPNDEPWTEHAKWFPECEFVLQQLGTDYVSDIVARYPNLPRPALQNGVSNYRSHRGGANNRSPSPLPEIIDPQAELDNAKRALAGLIENSFPLDQTTINAIVDCLHTSYQDEIEAITNALQNPDANTGNEVFGTFTENVFNNKFCTPDQQCELCRALQTSGEVQSPIGMRANSASPTSSGNQSPEPMNGSSSSGNQSPTELMKTTPKQSEAAEGKPQKNIEAKLKELQENKTCKICLDRDSDSVFVPCGHLCSCMKCAQHLRKCPICRVKIEKIIRTYTS